MPTLSRLNALMITNKIKALFLAYFMQLLKTNFASQSRYVFLLEKLSFEHNFQIHTSSIMVLFVPVDRYLCGVFYITH